MKLRLRSIESNETVKLEVPNSCTLQFLAQTLISRYPSLPPSSSLRFSLNRKDQLLSDESLSSLGITSGDLIYFSHNPSSFSSSRPPQSQSESMGSSSMEPEGRSDLELKINQQQTPVTDFDEEAMDVYLDSSPSSKQQTPVANFEEKAMDVDFDSSSSSTQQTLVTDFAHKDMVVFGSSLTSGVAGSDYQSSQQIDLNDSDGHKLLVMAVHAVFVESGFIGVGLQNVAENWSSNSRLVLTYTLPQLLISSGNGDRDNDVESVVLKFQTLSHFLNVYGSLSKGGSGMYCAKLNRKIFAPALGVLWYNCDRNENDGSLSFKPEKEEEVFEFWKAVKDGLALPLLIDLCEKSGFSLPACFTRLPMELKLKIMESLPGVDIGRMACVCTEMRFLSSNTDLWRLKYAEEFGDGAITCPFNGWKEKFVFCWENRKKRKREEIRMRQGFPRVYRPFYFPIRRSPNPLVFFSPIIGGHYDYVPGYGFGLPLPCGQPPSPSGQLHQTSFRSHVSRSFSPICNLGGFNR